MIKILNYSDDDFPSLDSGSRKKKAPNKAPCSAQHFYHNNGDMKTRVRNTYSVMKDRSSRKVLSPNEHKKTFRIMVEEALKIIPEKTTIKSKSRSMKRVENRNLPSGNPLDADSPIRLKGKVAPNKKPKRLSKIKRLVLKNRQDVREAGKLLTKIDVNEQNIFSNSVIPRECLGQTYFGKPCDMKNMIRHFFTDVSEIIVDSSNLEVNACNVATSDSYKYVKSQGVCENHESETEVSKISGSTQSAEKNATCLSDVRDASYKLLIHHHNFRRYCDNCITRELNQSTEALISQIVRFQYNKYQTNPIKAIADKRYVIGFKQVRKFTKLNRVKFIVFVPDMEESMSELVRELTSLASAYCIPYAFALTRRKLGFLCYKKVGACCFGLLDSSGAELNFTKTMEATFAARKRYQKECSSAVESCKSLVHDYVSSGETPNIDEAILKDFHRKLSLSHEN